MRLLPFDAHNHVHLGPTSPIRALFRNPDASGNLHNVTQLCGMAIMSTHPRDYQQVIQLSKDLPSAVEAARVVPCLGVHPWFLHEIEEQDWEPVNSSVPKWLHELEMLLQANPQSMVGEIGLDGHRYNPETKQLASPMDRQVLAFEKQLEIAARLNRPVSIHSVQSWGPMMETLSRLKKKSKTGLPDTIYFHAFGGKIGTVDQLTAICGRDQGRTYFGFAPIINFRSPKTVAVIQKVGLDRLVLETDHEDAGRVADSMQAGIQLLAEALETSEDEIVQRTTKNAFDLYRLSS